MGLSNLFRIAIRAIIRNRMRAVLTTLGIIIGVASVIAMLAIGEGAKRNIESEMSDMGTNMIMIMPNYQERGGVTMGGTISEVMKMNDVEAIKNEASAVIAVSPEVQISGPVVYGNQNTYSSISGVNEDYMKIRKLEISSGRMFTNSEIKSMAKVCILGQTVVENLFGAGVDPVGLSIRIKNLPFLIIGTLKAKGGAIGQDQDDVIIAPYTTVQRRLAAIDYIQGIYASAVTESHSKEAMKQIEEILTRTHKIKDNEEPDFDIMSQSDLMDTFSSISNILTILLGSIAGISLLVGGIGIMNIMFVSVTERTREIGLRMSIGGRGRDILKQFLVESILLSIAGGILGIILGYLLARIAGSLLNFGAYIQLQSVILAFTVCFAIGVFFGWYPARKAAGLNPIDALRYE